MSDWVFKCIFPGKDILGRWKTPHSWQYIAIPPEGKVKTTGMGPLPKLQLLLSRHFLSEHVQDRSSLTFPHLPWQGSSCEEQKQSSFPTKWKLGWPEETIPLPRAATKQGTDGSSFFPSFTEEMEGKKNQETTSRVGLRWDLRVGH